ncbi:hypothetical protein [Sulfitobacter sp. JB4-11]
MADQDPQQPNPPAREDDTTPPPHPTADKTPSDKPQDPPVITDYASL